MSSFSAAQCAADFVDQVWNSPEGAARLGQWLAPGYRDHAYPDDAIGLARALTELRLAFADARFEIESVIGSDSQAALRLRLTGTHTGPFRLLPPSGRQVEVKAYRWLRFEQEKVAEHWALLDTASLLKQISG